MLAGLLQAQLGAVGSSKLYFEKLDESTSVACNASSKSRLQHTASSKLNILVRIPNVIWRPGAQIYLSDACVLCAQYWIHMYVLVNWDVKNRW